MRAIFLDNIESDNIEITDAKFHHYKNVLRLTKGQTVLAINGKGLTRDFVIIDVFKKSIILYSNSPIITHRPKHNYSLAIGQLKKDAMDLVFKMSVELGVNDFFVLKTEYSQRYKLNFDRINTIFENAIEQSNSPFKPKLRCLDFKDFLELKRKLFYLSMESLNQKNVDNSDNYTLVIGPEAGFSSIEHDSLCQNIDTVSIHLGTNIMRAPTALAIGIGYLLK